MNEQYLLDLDLRRVPALAPDVVVVGSGIAALIAALTAAENASVMIVTKEELKESNTYYAQGGIAAALSSDDTPEAHLRDTLTVGAGLCDEEAVRKLVTEGPGHVKTLIEWGTPFDRDGEELSLTREGGHGCRRILHADGDATGRAIELCVVEKVRSHPNISILESHFAIDLLHENNVCYGIVVLDVKAQRFLKLESRATVLASGGLGRLYRETTNPEVTTGDGMAMAFRAGATVQDMEFVQFHPTVLYLAGAKRFLISEAARGEGAHLLNPKGHRFMPDYDERGELAPRDVVSQAIFREMCERGATNVFLSLAHLDPKMVLARFPNICKTLKQYGLDFAKDRIPVRPACHYMMGGVKTDLLARTNVERLLAAGEVASCGIHGANRLASNSLLDGLVFGHEAGRQALALAEQSLSTFPEKTIRTVRNKETFPLDVSDVRASLRSLTSRAAGILRDAETMSNAVQMLDFWQNYVYAEEFQTVAGLELQNMIICAQLVLRSAIEREESRGAHQRSDFPKTDDARWKRHVVKQRNDFE
jgi:L-aspartate oxidase